MMTGLKSDRNLRFASRTPQLPETGDGKEMYPIVSIPLLHNQVSDRLVQALLKSKSAEPHIWGSSL